MGDILRRRGMMVQAGGSSEPLYSFNDLYSDGADNGVNTSYCTLQFSSGNHFKYYGRNRGNNSRKWASFTNAGGINTDKSAWPTMFNLYAGDALKIILKNGYVYCNQSASYNGYVQFGLRNAADANIGGWTGSSSDSPLYTVGKTRNEFSELVYETTIAADVTAAFLRFYAYGNAQACQMTLEADLEVYVNDERYI